MMDFFEAEFVLGNVAYHFRFSKLHTPLGLKYFVDAVGGPDTKYSFMMEKNADEWRVGSAPKMPDIILNIESELSAIIKNNIHQ
jgi:hypothetical protein